MRSRRGKLRKAREGKVIGSYRANYGFHVNKGRDGYEVADGEMEVIRRIFRMVAVDGMALNAIARTLAAEGIPNPTGGRYWYKRNIKGYIFNDVYKPHSFEEIESLVSAEVAARLDKEKSYGIWWFNRRRTTITSISEMGPGGRVYKKKHHVTYKDRSEQIAVPVPDSEIPREWVDVAREIVSSYRSPSKLSGRFWELSGALMRCEECGRAMEPVDRAWKTGSGEMGVLCYYRCREGNRRKGTCSNKKSIRSDHAHTRFGNSFHA